MNSWDIDFYPIDVRVTVELHGFFHALWVHLVFWTSFVLHSHLTNCDCLWFTEGLFWPLQIRKNIFVWMTLISVLCHISPKISVFMLLVCSKLDCTNIVARHFSIRCNTIQSLLIVRRFRQSGNTRDRQRSGRPRVTSCQQDDHIRLVHLRDRFQTSSLTTRSIHKKHRWITTNQL